MTGCRGQLICKEARSGRNELDEPRQVELLLSPKARLQCAYRISSTYARRVNHFRNHFELTRRDRWSAL